MRVIYLAHPVGAPTVEGVQANLASARDWLRFLIGACPDVAFCVSWLPYLNVLEDTGASRERGLRDDCEMVRRCDAVLMVGDRVSAGMRREADCAHVVIDGTGLPREDVAVDVNQWARWSEEFA